jgi:hypothetical protein
MSLKKSYYLLFLIVILGYFFRLIFGLNYEFWFVDNMQVYLIGLKYYTTGLWPYWGPDIVFSNSSIPGALQGLLVGSPFYLLKIPEAPFILVNLLSIFSLTFFAWYLSKRIPGIPKYIMLIWLFTLPAFMYYSATVQNPSYVIFAGILFFISIFELFPFYEERIISENLLFFILGFSLLWIYQIHLSWVLLIPYIILAFFFKFTKSPSRRDLIKPFLFFIAGCLICFGTLLPTLIQFDRASTESLTSNISLNFSNLIRIIDILFNFFSFSTFQAEVFIPENVLRDSQLMNFLLEYYWIIPLVLFLLLARAIQFVYVIIFFWKKNEIPGWKKIQYFVIFSLALLWLSFIFTEHFPSSHKYYLLLPISVWYSLHAYREIYQSKRGKFLANLFLGSGILFYILVVVIYINMGHSLYTNRVVVQKAIDEMDYTLLGTRRESAFQQKQTESPWKSISANAAEIFSTDMECKNKYFQPQNITCKKAHSGLYSCKVDSVQPFAVGFAKTIDSISNYKSVKASMWILTSKLETDAVFVTSIQDNSKVLFWKGAPLKTKLLKPEGWQEIAEEVDLPAGIFSKGPFMFKVYVWNPSKTGELFYVDDIKVQLNKKQSR